MIDLALLVADDKRPAAAVGRAERRLIFDVLHGPVLEGMDSGAF